MQRDREQGKPPSGAVAGQDASRAVSRSEGPDAQVLIDLATMPMPFGRYRGRTLIDLPEPYVVWFRQQGYPRGRLGMLLASLYEVKANGLEHLVRELRDRMR